MVKCQIPPQKIQIDGLQLATKIYVVDWQLHNTQTPKYILIKARAEKLLIV